MISKYSNQWIVDSRFDLFFFSLSALITPVIILAHSALGASVVFIFLLFMLLLEVTHVVMTFARTHLDIEVGSERLRNLNYLLLFVVVFGAAVAFLDLLPEFYSMLVILGVWHIGRQNIGIIKFYNFRKASASQLDHFLEVQCYQVLIVLFAAYELMNMLGEAGRFEGPLKSLGYSYLVVLLARLIWIYLNYKVDFNLPKALFLLMSFSNLFYILVIADLDPLLAAVLLSAAHDLQYFGWMRFYQKRSRFKWNLKGPIIGIGALVLILLLSFGGWAYVQYDLALLALPYFLVLSFHYLADGYVWRFGQDHALRSNLLSSGKA